MSRGCSTRHSQILGGISRIALATGFRGSKTQSQRPRPIPSHQSLPARLTELASATAFSTASLTTPCPNGMLHRVTMSGAINGRPR